MTRIGLSNRTLNQIKTPSRLAAATVLLLALLMVLVGGACATETKTYLSLMSTVPKSTTHFVFWAIGDLNADQGLWDIYNKFKESDQAKQVKQFVPVLSVVEQSAKAVSYDNFTAQGSVAVLRGDLDANELKGELETFGYSQTLYKEIGIWTPADNQTSHSVALQSNIVFMGDALDLKACIDVVTKGKSQSLDEDSNIQFVAAKLPNGLIVEIDKADSSHGEQYTDLVAYGKSYTKANKDMLKLTAVYMFGDGPSAGSAQSLIENYLAAKFTNYKAQRSGNFVVATAEISISEFVQSLEF